MKLNYMPFVYRLAIWGIPASLLLRVLVWVLVQIVAIVEPAVDVTQQVWFLPLLVVIWAPALAALIAGNITVICYPDSSLDIELPPMLSDSIIWKLIGCVFVFVGLCLSLAAFGFESPAEIAIGIYLGLTFLCNGYLLLIYKREKNVVIATFLDITHKVGIVLIPFYIPALILGAWKLRYMRSVEELKQTLRQQDR
ncbi:MAG: hypothetical protein AAF483_23465 [Planctomycetota bacterium]